MNKIWESNQGQLGLEASVLTIVLCAPHPPPPPRLHQVYFTYVTRLGKITIEQKPIGAEVVALSAAASHLVGKAESVICFSRYYGSKKWADLGLLKMPFFAFWA